MPNINLGLKNVSIFLLGLMLIMTSNTAFAQVGYVTDDFEIMMRTGPSIQNKIIKVLRSGDKLEVLREDAGNGHSQIQTNSGDIGYVLTRFITAKEPASSRVSYLENQLQFLSAEPTDVSAMLVASQDENRDLIEQNTALTDRLSKQRDKLERLKKVSSGPADLYTKNQELEAEVQQLLLQLDDFRIQNEDLKDQSKRLNTLIGAGLISLGLFLGWVLSISGRRSRSSWGM